MEIKINNKVRPDLSDDEYKYLRLLEFHAGFIKGVKDIRSNLDIPVGKDGETITSFKPPEQLSEGLDFERKLRDGVSKLVLKLGIPYMLLGCVESFIKWGQVLMATKPILVLNPEYQLNKSLLFNKKIWPKGKANTNDPKVQSMIDKSWYEHNQSLVKKYGTSPFIPVILIAKPLTKKELHEAIDREWVDRIAPAIEDYKKSVPYSVDIAKVPVREIEDYINLLRLKQEGKTHQEIADQLHMGHDSIREKFSKITKFFKRIGFPSLGL